MKGLSIAMVALAALAFAADLTGQWTGSFDMTAADGSANPSTAYLDLKVSGSTVTGTIGPSQEQQHPIKNGKLDGKKLTFEIGGDDHPAIKFDLVYEGDTIKGTAIQAEGQKMSAKLDVKRKQ